MNEKPGGYDAKLTKRTREMRDANVAYQREFHEGQRESFPENVRLADEILDSIDKAQLKKIFLEYLRRSGVSENDANDEVLDSVLVTPNSGAAAAYSSFENTMAFRTSDRDFVAAKREKKRGGEISKSLLIKLRLFLIHELVHAFAYNRIYSTNTESPRSVMHVKGGYQSDAYSYAEGNPDTDLTLISHSFEAFNEGMTQRIAEEIFMEYHRRVGDRRDAQIFLKTFIGESAKDLWRYSIFGNQVSAICDAVSEYTGVPESTVWEGFKRGYFEKPELFYEDTIRFFKETFGKDFLTEYAAIDRHTPKGEIAKLDGRSGFPHPEGYAEKWLQHLGLSEGREA